MSNYAKVNNQSVNTDIQNLCANYPANLVGFLAHTNANGNAPAYATEQDEEVFTAVKEASMNFKSTVLGSANSSMIIVDDLTTLLALSPVTALTSVACPNATSINYLTTCGVFALNITNVVISGSTGNLTLLNFLPIFGNPEYELIIGYFSDVLEANISFGFDLTGVSPIGADTAVAYEFIKDQEVLTAINGKYVLQGNGTVKIIGFSIVSRDIGGVATSVYQISVQA